MKTILVLLLALVLFAEIWLTGTIARFLGFWNTAIIIVFKIAFGIRMVFRHGRETLKTLRAAVKNRQIPEIPVIEGALFMAAPFLIMMPGFLVSMLGLLLLLDRGRSWVAEMLRKIGIAWLSGKYLR